MQVKTSLTAHVIAYITSSRYSLVCFIGDLRLPSILLYRHHHLFAQNTIKVDSGYVNEQDRKAHCALTSATLRRLWNAIHKVQYTA